MYRIVSVCVAHIGTIQKSAISLPVSRRLDEANCSKVSVLTLNLVEGTGQIPNFLEDSKCFTTQVPLII